MQFGLRLDWNCLSGLRADRLDRRLARAMSAAGCRQAAIGVESLEVNAFTHIRKGERPEQIQEAISLLKEAGIVVTGFFIVGLPGCLTYRSFIKALDRYEELHLHYVCTFPSARYDFAPLGGLLPDTKCKDSVHLDRAIWELLIPYLGSRVYKQVLEAGGCICRDYREGFDRGSNIGPIHELPEFTRKQLWHAFIFANLRSQNYYPFLHRRGATGIFHLLLTILRHDPKRLGWHIRCILQRVHKNER